MEEQTGCIPAWCGRVAVPPALPFILVEMTVLGLPALRLHARSLGRVTLAFCVYGVLWEYFLGGLRRVIPSLEAVLTVPYVALGYTYVSLIPVSALMKAAGEPRSAEPGAGAWTRDEQPLITRPRGLVSPTET